MKVLQGTLVFVALLSVAMLSACGKSQPAAAAAPAGGPPPAMPVQVEPARQAPVEDSSTYVASVQSRASMLISPLVTGNITDIPVHSGDSVDAGALLVQIDDSIPQAALRVTENSVAAEQATLTYDKQQLDRIQQLFDSKIETQADLQSAQSTYNNALAQLASLQAQVRQQQVQLSYYKVGAPRAGIVGDIPVKVGDQVSTNTQLTTLDDRSGMEVYVQVPIEQAHLLHAGLPLEILDSQGNPIAPSRVSFVSPQVDSTTQSILVKAGIDPATASRVRAQQFVQARITWGSHMAFLVPVLDVQRINGRFFVYLAQKQGPMTAVHQAPVEVGGIVGNNYEVGGGLKPGDLIIVSNVQILGDGMPVMPLPPAAGRGAPPTSR